MTELDKSAAPAGVDNNETIRVLDLYQTAEKIYNRRLPGFFRTLSRWTWAPFVIAYYAIPWLNMDGRQAVWFNLAERKFYIFGLTFWPQDFPLLAWLLIIAAFALFTITNLLGRIWCGFACPQTTYTRMFMAIEQWFEGNPNQRMKLDKGPWDFNKVWRKSGKQLLWFGLALATGITFVGYFNPIRNFFPDFFTLNAPVPTAFWALFFTVATWLNAGFMREQICMYACPYARFQSVMYDRDTLIVSYDAKRGEARGPRKKNQNPAELGLGDCVDCTLCVQVCPVGIDIRDGLQYQCINCGLCIDACNTVMDKLEYPRGLVRMSSENALENHQKVNFLRPRFIGYLIALLLISAAFSYKIITRIPVELDIIRDRDMLYRTTADGFIENSYQLKIANKDQSNHRYHIGIESDLPLRLIGQQAVMIEAGEMAELLLRLRLPKGLAGNPAEEIRFVVWAEDKDSIRTTQDSRFLSPFGKK